MLEEPYIAQKLFNEVIKFAVKAMDSDETHLADVIYLTLRLKVPPLPSIVPPLGKSSIPTKGLFVIKGIIIARTLSSKYW